MDVWISQRDRVTVLTPIHLYYFLKMSVIRAMWRYQRTDILWTKSPNRFKYADSLEGPLAVLGISGDDEMPFVAVLLLFFLFLRPFSVPVSSIVEFLIAWGDTWECECEECPCASSSPPRTRKVFSIKKKAAKPTNIPKLEKIKIKAFNLRMHDSYPIRMFRFSSTMTKWTPEPWCSPINECGIRCKKTSESKPPVYVANQQLCLVTDTTRVQQMQSWY